MVIALKVTVERGEVAAGEEAVVVGLGVPVFVAVAGVAEEGHEGFVVVDARCGDGGDTVFLAF